VPRKGVQSFLELAGYYRKFIEDFSKIAKPLIKLTERAKNLTGRRNNKIFSSYWKKNWSPHRY